MKSLTITCSIILSLFFLEFITRFFLDNGLNYELEMMKYANKLKEISLNKKIGIEHKKNVSAMLMKVNVSLNEKGFRNNNEINLNSKKILMLGDSMTFGWGAQNPFPNLLNDVFDNYEVINAGIGNTNTIMQVNNFMENFSKYYHYDLIVLNFYINDLEDVVIKKPNILEKYSFAYTYFSASLNKILIKFRPKKNWENFYKNNFNNKKLLDETLKSIISLKKYCLENNTKLIIHNIPELRNLKNYKFSYETKIIKEFAEENDIVFYDSFNVLKKFESNKLWVTKEDPHANDLAHKIIAENLSFFLNTFLMK